MLMRLLAAVVINAVFGGVVLFYIYHIEVTSRYKAVTSEEETIHVRLQLQAASETFHTITSDLLYLAEQPILKNLFLREKQSGAMGDLATHYLLFASRKPIYDQIRLLSEVGKEVVRVNHHQAGAVLVPADQLQDKKNRYYFKETITLDAGDVLISRFDLNMEHGQVEKPYRPMIRFATPVVDAQGVTRGVLVLNYKGDVLLEQLARLSGRAGGKFNLLDDEGYWLSGAALDNQWGFMFPERANDRFQSRFPDAWSLISQKTSGILRLKAGVFIFATVDPLHIFNSIKGGEIVSSGGSMASAGYPWKVVSYLSTASLTREIKQVRLQYGLVYLLFLGLVAAVSYSMIKLLTQREILVVELRKREQLLKTSHDHLEEMVDERTSKLRSMNQRLAESILKVKKMEDQLRLSVAEWNQTFDAIPDFISVHDKNYQILRVNKTLAEFQDLPATDFTGQRCHDVFCQREEPCDCTLTKALHKKQSITEEVESSCLGRFFLVTAAPIYDQAGEVEAVVHYAKDISHLKKIRHEQFVAGKLESIGVLAGGIAHDFNNLLTTILGNISFAKMLTTQPGRGVELRAVLEEAERASHRASELTGQLLTFSLGGSPVKSCVQLNELLNDMVHFALSGTNVKCCYQAEPGLWAVELDQQQIGQVVTNMLLNGVQAMPQGGKIWVRAENSYLSAENTWSLSAGGYVKISIQDEGKGIPEKIKEQVFDPYFTTKNRGTEKGSGLGLAICFSIMKKHGGHIAFESRVQTGTTFFLFFPVSATETIAAKTTSEDDQSSVTANVDPSPNINLSSRRVLVMDDEQGILDLVRLTLCHVGYEVITVYDGKAAMTAYQEALIKGVPFDLVMMDLTIPGGMGGEEMMKQLLTLDPEAKAVVSSGFSNDPVMAHYREYGFCGAVAKPYQPVELIKVVASTLATPT